MQQKVYKNRIRSDDGVQYLNLSPGVARKRKNLIKNQNHLKDFLMVLFLNVCVFFYSSKRLLFSKKGAHNITTT